MNSERQVLNFAELADALANQAERCGRLEERLASRGEEIDQLRADVARLGGELRRTEAERDAVLAKLQQGERELENASQTARSQAYALDWTKGELNEARSELASLRRSWSWRLTAPLRGIAEAPRRLLALTQAAGRRTLLGGRLTGWLQWRLYGKLVRNSGLFDSDYYREEYPDVAAANADPLQHFFLFGAAELRNPHPLFNVEFYLTHNADVAASCANPLVHYLKKGAAQRRDPHPEFDTAFYLRQDPEIAGSGLNPLVHFLGPGTARGLNPNPWFNSVEYLEKHPDAALNGINPLVHDLTYGRAARMRHLQPREESGVSARPEVLTANGLPAGMRIDPRATELRSALRGRYHASNLLRLDDAFHAEPAVSVIIPCFNYGFYLEDAILSARLACSSPMEIVVVDDGSTDKQSVAEVERLAREYNFRLITQPNSGQAGARLNGLGQSRGKFIQFLDADDFLAPGKIDRQLKLFAEQPETDIAVCEYELCGADGSGRRVIKPSTLAGFDFSADDFLLRWERGFTLPIHCALFRRTILGSEHFHDITRSGKEDWLFWIVIAAGSPRFAFHPDVMATYRVHGQNTFSNRKGMGLDFLRACMFVLQSGLTRREDFLEKSMAHFETAYLGGIKRDAIAWLRPGMLR